MLPQSRHMQLRAVPFVLGKSVLWVNGVEGKHQPIASDFCHDTRRRDTEAECVPADERGLGEGKGADRESINEHMIWRLREL